MALTDYVIMPSADYQAACDKLREKTGKSGLIKSGDMANEIDAMSWPEVCDIDNLAISILEGTIESITNNTLTTICPYALSDCDNLTYAKFDKLTSIPDNMFFSDALLKTAIFPLATYIGLSAFQSCPKLEEIECPMVETIRDYAFNGCKMLNKLVLKNTTGVCSIEYYTFYNSPFASGGTGGTVYVPEALIESYKTAEYWSTLYNAGTCTFVAIEGSEYEEGV